MAQNPTEAEIHRLKLHDILINLIQDRVLPAWFQPGPTVTLSYPCILYRQDRPYTRYADNNKYFTKKRWTVTVVDRNPDSDIPALLQALPLCEEDRFYISDGLNHWVFTLFF